MLAEHPDGMTIPELRGALGASDSGLRRTLDALAAAGVVEAGARPPVGPGRPSALYRLAPSGGDGEELLAVVIGLVASAGTLDESAIRRLGRDQGRRLARAGDADAVVTPMARMGFAPQDVSRAAARKAGRQELRFASCPFRSAIGSGGVWAVCALHHGLLEGLGDAAGADVEWFAPVDPISAGCEARMARRGARSEP